MPYLRLGLLLLTTMLVVGCSTCEKFVHYDGTAVDVSGIKAKLGEKIQADVGQLKIDKKKYREASEELQRLDLTQYTTCKAIESVAEGPQKEELKVEYAKKLLQLDSIVEGVTRADRKKPEASRPGDDWNDPRFSEARKNISWIFSDGPAANDYSRGRAAGNSKFQALQHAQRGRDQANARGTIIDYGEDRANRFLETLGR